MDKVFELKCYESGLGRYNATKVYIIHVVCDNVHQAIKSVLKDDIITVEVVSVNPCLIIK